MELNEAFKKVLQETADTLKGAERRRFLAQTVQALGAGGNAAPSANWVGTA